MSGLQAPRIDTSNVNAPHEGSDGSDDHYSSASEGALSPIPITRVERVDDSAQHGEVPGTDAYNLRLQDAVPDEVEIVPEGLRSRSNTTSSQRRGRGLSSAGGDGTDSRSPTPGGSPIPRTVVDKVDFKPSHGEVDGTKAKEMRMADALPDEVRQAPEETRQRLEGRDGREKPDNEIGDNDDTDEEQDWLQNSWRNKEPLPQATRQLERTTLDHEADAQGDLVDEREQEEQDDEEEEEEEEEVEEDGFGDDFDDFAEGEESNTFGDFDEAERTAPDVPDTAPNILSGLPPLDLSACTSADDVREAIEPYVTAILPNSTSAIPKSTNHPLSASDFPAFHTDRSLSLWQQLVSPPPMQPPNWTKSRIRRLFLVSLGVPVDLDEILPPSKQKRLVLPSIGLADEEDGFTASRPSTSAVERLREQNDNESSTSIDSKTGAPKARKSRRIAAVGGKGAPSAPQFDLNAASLLCSTTEAALGVYSDDEMKEHVQTLERLNEEAGKVLEYYLSRYDEGLKEKEALEGVIENLVGFVKGRRGK